MVSSRFRKSLAAIATVIKNAQAPLPWLLAVAGGFVLVALLGALPPIFTGRIVDALQHLRATDAMYQLGLYVAVTIGYGVVGGFSTYATAALREALVRNLRLALMAKLQRARFDELSAITLGEVATRITADIEMMCNQLEYSVLPTLQGAISIAATAAIMLTQNVPLSIVSFTLVAFVIIPLRVVTPRLAAMQKDYSSMRDDLCGTVNETANLGAQALLRNVRAAARERTLLRDLVDRMRRMRLAQTALGETANLATILLNVLGPVAILGVGTYLLLHHQIASIGVIITFLMFHGRLAGPFAGLSSLPMQIASVGVLANRLVDIFGLREEVSGAAIFANGTIDMREIRIARDGRTILDGASVSIPRGGRIAIVGPSGSGKSTLAMLPLRLYDPDSGSVRIGGQGVSDFDLGDLRNAVALVSQDPLIFDTSLYENLTYTNPSVSQERVLEAIDFCLLGDLVATLPEGLQTRLGQRGFRLSGGERQRICLARAILGDPQILILDEALTGVDAESEATITAGLRERLVAGTLVVVTHRLRAIAEFDSIIVVEGGRVSAQGTDAELCATSDWYGNAVRFARTPLEVAR